MDKHQSIITKSAQETAAVGERMAGTVAPNVYCLYGDLGSGKTTFAQGFAKGLGITSRLLSPTFIIVRRYEIPNTTGFLYHVDLYRLHTSHSLDDIGLREILTDPQSYVVIEWAEKLGRLRPQKRTDISFTLTPEGHHRIERKAYI